VLININNKNIIKLHFYNNNKTNKYKKRIIYVTTIIIYKMVLISSLKEGYALIIHYISLLCFITVIYITKNRNKPLTYFSIAAIGHTCSEIFRIMLFGFSMKDSPKWSVIFTLILISLPSVWNLT